MKLRKRREKGRINRKKRTNKGMKARTENKGKIPQRKGGMDTKIN